MVQWLFNQGNHFKCYIWPLKSAIQLLCQTVLCRLVTPFSSWDFKCYSTLICAMNRNLLQWQKLFGITLCFSEVKKSCVGGHGVFPYSLIEKMHKLFCTQAIIPWFFFVYTNQMSHITYQAYIAAPFRLISTW